MPFIVQPILPIKYILGLQASTPNYPTTQDFMFEVISYIVRVAEAKEKDWDPQDIKFSAKTLKYIFGENMKSEEVVDRIKLRLKELLDSEILEKRGEYIYISETEFTRYYSIS